MWHRTNVLLLGTGIASFILLGLAMSIFGPVLPVYGELFGLEIASVGWLLSLFWAGCLGGVGLVYVLPQRMGPKTGLAMAGAGTALMALMGNWAVVLAGGALFGAGYGVIAAVYNPRVLAAFGPRGPAMMSLMNAIFTLGAIAAPQVFVLLGRNPSLTFALFTGFTLIILLAAVPMGNTRTAQADDTRPVRLNWPVLAFAAFGIGLESSLVGLGPTALVLAGESQQDAADLLSTFFIAYLAARGALVWIAPHVAPFRLYIAAVGVTAALALAATWGQPALWFPLMGFGAGFYFQSGFLTGLNLMGSTTRVSAVMLAAGLVGAILLPMSIAQVLDHLGPKGFFQIVLGLCTALLVVSLLLAPRMLRRDP